MTNANQSATNTAVTTFNFGPQDVRCTMLNGEPWFVAADVCDALTIANNRDAISRLDADEKGVATTDTPSGQQEMTTINESGLYSLIMTSRKPEAKKFKKWVTSEVLPAIRKTGRYAMPGAAPATPVPTPSSVHAKVDAAVCAAQAIPQFILAGQALGLGPRAAVIGANRMALGLTGVDVLEMLVPTQRPRPVPGDSGCGRRTANAMMDDAEFQALFA